MDEIERIWITGGEFGGDKILYDEADVALWRERGHEVWGPFVPEPPETHSAPAERGR